MILMSDRSQMPCLCDTGYDTHSTDRKPKPSMSLSMNHPEVWEGQEWSSWVKLGWGDNTILL